MTISRHTTMGDENYDFDSLGSLENVLDNNLSKSKKEAVLLRRQTDRRRKPSKKFRHTQYDPSEYSNNPFLDEFMDSSSRLKKAVSTNLEDLIDESRFESGRTQAAISKSAEEIDLNNNNNKTDAVRLRGSGAAVNRRLTQTQFKTQSVHFIPTLPFESKPVLKMPTEIESQPPETASLTRSRSLKSKPFAASIDQIQSELGKLKVIEKQAPKIIRFNSTEDEAAVAATPPPPANGAPSASKPTTRPASVFVPNAKDVKLMKFNTTTTTNTTTTDKNTQQPQNSLFSSGSYSQFEAANSKSVKLRSNSFQRPPPSISTTPAIKSEFQQKLASFTEQIKPKPTENDNLENVKPSSLKAAQQQVGTSSPTPITTATTAHAPAQPSKTTIINVVYKPPVNSSSTGSSTQAAVVKSPTTIQQQIKPSNSITHSTSNKTEKTILTENNNRTSEYSADMPTWKLELMKRKRNMTIVTAERLVKEEEAKLSGNSTKTVYSKSQTTITSTVLNNKNVITIETPATAAPLKPTFQSNSTVNTNNTQQNSKLVHNSIGSPVVSSPTKPAEQPTPPKTTSTFMSDVPEWKRTLIEKKKLKKVF